MSSLPRQRRMQAQLRTRIEARRVQRREEYLALSRSSFEREGEQEFCSVYLAGYADGLKAVQHEQSQESPQPSISISSVPERYSSDHDVENENEEKCAVQEDRPANTLLEVENEYNPIDLWQEDQSSGEENEGNHEFNEAYLEEEDREEDEEHRELNESPAEYASFNAESHPSYIIRRSRRAPAHRESLASIPVYRYSTNSPTPEQESPGRGDFRGRDVGLGLGIRSSPATNPHVLADGNVEGFGNRVLRRRETAESRNRSRSPSHQDCPRGGSSGYRRRSPHGRESPSIPTRNNHLGYHVPDKKRDNGDRRVSGWGRFGHSQWAGNPGMAGYPGQGSASRGRPAARTTSPDGGGLAPSSNLRISQNSFGEQCAPESSRAQIHPCSNLSGPSVRITLFPNRGSGHPSYPGVRGRDVGHTAHPSASSHPGQTGNSLVRQSESWSLSSVRQQDGQFMHPQGSPSASRANGSLFSPDMFPPSAPDYAHGSFQGVHSGQHLSMIDIYEDIGAADDGSNYGRQSSHYRADSHTGAEMMAERYDLEQDIAEGLIPSIEEDSGSDDDDVTNNDEDDGDGDDLCEHFGDDPA